jgi:hypothetical protein
MNPQTSSNKSYLSQTKKKTSVLLQPEFLLHHRRETDNYAECD